MVKKRRPLSDSESDYMDLYKKYRPKTWGEVVGEKPVIDSILTAVKNNALPSAYLFSGPRGCGKTTVARLLAKTLNCTNLDEDFNPCNECKTCKAIDSNSFLGVHYISAANNGDISSIRNILSSIQRRTLGVKRPIWIIDEFQNLSKQAFDTFLIPLEQDSPNALFIFCTTRISKIPLTLVSRSQARTFTLVPEADIRNICTKILINEGFKLVDNESAENSVPTGQDASKTDNTTVVKTNVKILDLKARTFTPLLVDKALQLAEVGEKGGSVRQAISSLEFLLSNPTVDDIVRKQWHLNLVKAIFWGMDAVGALRIIRQVVNDDSSLDDLNKLTTMIVNDLRSIIVSTDLPSDCLRAKILARYGVDTLLDAYTILGSTPRGFNLGRNPLLMLEVNVIKTVKLLQKSLQK
jgi:hypothetical protein